MLVKTDIHIHTSEDREDTFIKYSAKDIIDEASKKRIDAIAITLHRYVLPTNKFNKLKIYAKTKNVLLISGVEAKIEGKHVLIYNIKPGEYAKINTFEDLRKLREKNHNIFVVAPHPFMPKSPLTKNCLQDRYFENKDLFDALEFQQFYSFFLNPNKKTAEIAKKDDKSLVASSDLHFKRFFGRHYTVVDVKGKLDEKNLFDAIKKGKTRVVSNTTFPAFCSMLISFTFHAFDKENFRS